MNRFVKLAVLSATLAATTVAALPSAHAGDNWRRHHHQRGGDGDLLAAGILGLAIGAIAAGVATANQPDYEYYEPVRRDPRPRPRPDRTYYYDQPEVVYLEGPILDPWSPEWYRYCEDTYRTFNPRTGTFIGYDGKRHFCEAN
jgi:hypothetical protein